MPIPDYQSIMLPALKYLALRPIVTPREVAQAMVSTFNLTAAESEELLPSGTQKVINNRTNWALMYLCKAGLIERPSRGQYKLSPVGKSTLDEAPTKVDISYLSRFESFRAFHTVRPKDAPAAETKASSLSATDKNPIEEIERGYEELRKTVIDELLSASLALDPSDFELLVVKLLKKIGYGVPGLESVVHKGKSGDGGIDGEVSQDPLGLDMIYVQAKRYAEDSGVGRPALQQFVGSLNERKAKKGVFITTSYFTKEALDFIERVDVKIVLIDGPKLASLMYDYDLGVERVQIFAIKKINLDFFQED